MAIDFPNLPTLNQTFNGYVWDGEKWALIPPTGLIPSDALPLMNGTAASGSSILYSRGDHIHPIDTSRAPLASPAFTGTPTAPTASPGTNTTQLATTAFVQATITVSGAAPCIVSATEPTTAPDGVLWWETDTGFLYIKYNDGNSTQWVIACPQPDISLLVQKAGDTMGGPLILAANPTTALQATTKQYVDSGDSAATAVANNKVSKSGDTMTGPLTLAADPAAALQATTKQYVDAVVGGASTPSTVMPLVNATPGVIGVSTKYTREDHVHPTDTSRQAALGYTPVQQGTGVGQLANVIKIGWSSGSKIKATVDATDMGNIALESWAAAASAIPAASGTNPNMNGAVTPGSSAAWSRGDHVHPVDTSRQANLGYTPVNRAGDTLTGSLQTASGALITTGGPVGTFQVHGATNGAMSFLIDGVFGANFGITNTGNFYMGGWSFGGSQYQFWTTRDFVNAPMLNTRLTYNTDVVYTSTSIEQYPGCVLTGVQGGFIFRYRWLQVLNAAGSTWVTVSTP